VRQLLLRALIIAPFLAPTLFALIRLSLAEIVIAGTLVAPATASAMSRSNRVSCYKSITYS